jgi:hypothetical protein
MLGTEAMCLSEHASKPQGKLNPMLVQLRHKFLSRADRGALSRKGLQEASVCIWDLSYESLDAQFIESGS